MLLLGAFLGGCVIGALVMFWLFIRSAEPEPQRGDRYGEKIRT